VAVLKYEVYLAKNLEKCTTRGEDGIVTIKGNEVAENRYRAAFVRLIESSTSNT
jgi:hypothetical protein